MKYVIIGNGIAATCALEAIRRLDSHGRLTLISDEDNLPYSRPLISHLLAGTLPAAKLPLRPPSFYDDLGVETVFGHRVDSLDPTAKTVRTTAGKTFSYDRLLIATGGDPRGLAVPGHRLPGIFFLRRLADVRQLLPLVGEGSEAVVLGGGLVGFKAAEALRCRGLRVTMVIRSPWPLALQVDEFTGRLLLDRLRQHGIRVLLGREVKEFAGRERLAKVVLDDGREISAGLAVIGKGVRPAIDFVPAASIKTNQGILVDECLQTSVADVYAAGDAAEMWDLAYQEPRVNAIWPEAAAQGLTAGRNLAGRRARYPGSLGRNVIRFFTLDLLTIGRTNPPPDGPYRQLTAAAPDGSWYRKLVLHRDRLVGAILVNRIEDGGILQAVIRQQRLLRLPPAKLLDRWSWSELWQL